MDRLMSRNLADLSQVQGYYAPLPNETVVPTGFEEDDLEPGQAHSDSAVLFDLTPEEMIEEIANEYGDNSR
jgi:hypothetical protein